MVRLVSGMARAMAVLGGLVLAALILLTGISVAGRVLNTLFHGAFAQSWFPGLAKWALDAGVGPVNGDFELVEAGMAFAVFAFLPLCQITAGHATVDIFTSRLSPRASRILQAVTEVVFAAVLVIIAWKLYDGMASKLRSGQETFLLQTPVWWNYAASLAGAVVAAITGVFMAGVRILEMLSGRVIMVAGAEAGH